MGFVNKQAIHLGHPDLNFYIIMVILLSGEISYIIF